jgi:hypothetical protein
MCITYPLYSVQIKVLVGAEVHFGYGKVIIWDIKSYIAADHSQEHSNEEELVMYNCLWRKVVGNKYKLAEHKEAD